jgi:hypothetical protein
VSFHVTSSLTGFNDANVHGEFKEEKKRDKSTFAQARGSGVSPEPRGRDSFIPFY